MKNKKLLQVLMSQYRAFPNSYELSAAFLKETLPHAEYLQVTVTQIDNFKDLVFKKHIDMKKDIVEGIVEALNNPTIVHTMVARLGTQ